MISGTTMSGTPTSAHVVLAAAAPTTDAVAGAAAQLTDALDALEVDGEVPAPTVLPVSLTFEEGEAIVMPAAVTLRAFDGSTSSEAVTWSGAQGAIGSAGTFTVTGVTASGLDASATITVTPRNWLVNGSFEDPEGTSWTLTTDGNVGEIWIGATGDAADGSRALRWYDSSPFTIELAQTVTGLPAGAYALSATGQGRDTSGVIPAPADAIDVMITDGAGEARERMTLDGWHGDVGFVTASTGPLSVTEGATVTAAAELVLDAEAWGTLDDLRLVRVADPAVDTSALADAIGRAEAVDRVAFTETSLAALDLAVERGRIVLASTATLAQVDEAAAAVAEAIGALVPVTEPTDPSDPGDQGQDGDGQGEDGDSQGEDGDGQGVGPRLHASASTVRPGDTVTLTVTGARGARVEFGVESVYQRLATAPVTAGSATATVTIPRDLAPGTHHLVARDADGTELARLEIAVVAGEADGDALSDTGLDLADLTAPLLVALAFLLAGSALAARGRGVQRV